MPLIPVTSPDDPALLPYRHLRHINSTRYAPHFIAEGNKLVERLLHSPFVTRSVFVTDTYVPDILPHVQPETPVYVASLAVLEETIGFDFHRGCLACGERPQGLSLADWQPPAQGLWTIVACPDVQDPTNLGTILRNCAAFGVDLVLLGAQCADPFSRRVMRVSMGSVLGLKIVESRDLMADLQTLRDQHQVELVATVLARRATTLDQAPRAARMALLFGSEGHGLDAQWQAQAQQLVTIPMAPDTDSLNVAVASGIMLYHFTRCAKVMGDSGTPPAI